MPRLSPAVRQRLQSKTAADSNRTPNAGDRTSEATMLMPSGEGDERPPSSRDTGPVARDDTVSPSSKVTLGPRGGGSRWAVAAVGVGVLVLGAGGAWWLLATGEKPRPTFAAALTSPSTKATRPVPDRPLAPAEVAEFFGQQVVVEMEVKSTGKATTNPTIFLNSHANYRDPDNLTIVLEDRVQADLVEVVVGPLQEFYKGKTIRVRGKVSRYKDNPQIVVNQAEQLEVVEK
jgi:hypothetical protein